jgi:S-adenosylmethionine decarboxylase
MKNSAPTIYSPYGMQLCIDGYNASSTVCDNEKILISLLRTLPGKIGMRPLGIPHVVRVTEKGIAGLSGFTFIMESHISIHTYSERGFVTIDIYSCKSFESALALRIVQKVFMFQNVETTTLLRGVNFNMSTAVPP